MRKPESFRDQTPRPKSVPRICARNPSPKSATGISDDGLGFNAKIDKIVVQAELVDQRMHSELSNLVAMFKPR